jgi:hypothetical protein
MHGWPGMVAADWHHVLGSPRAPPQLAADTHVQIPPPNMTHVCVNEVKHLWREWGVSQCSMSCMMTQQCRPQPRCAGDAAWTR